jgi:hypothetical protein
MRTPENVHASMVEPALFINTRVPATRARPLSADFPVVLT